MKRSILLLMIVFAASTFVSGQKNSEEAVGKVLDNVVAALNKNDAAALEKIYADDYSLVSPSGMISGKAERIAEIKNGVTKYESYSIDERKIRVHGDAAVTTSRATIKGMSNKQDISGQYRITAMLAKIKGNWQIVAAQATRIGEP